VVWVWVVCWYLVVLTKLYVPASAFNIWCSVQRFSKPVSLWGRADASDAQAIILAAMLLKSIVVYICGKWFAFPGFLVSCDYLQVDCESVI
jgi:hypothetical protein